MSLHSPRVVVTGAGGFVGQALCQYLAGKRLLYLVLIGDRTIPMIAYGDWIFALAGSLPCFAGDAAVAYLSSRVRPDKSEVFS